MHLEWNCYNTELLSRAGVYDRSANDHSGPPSVSASSADRENGPPPIDEAISAGEAICSARRIGTYVKQYEDDAAARDRANEATGQRP